MLEPPSDVRLEGSVFVFFLRILRQHRYSFFHPGREGRFNEESKDPMSRDPFVVGRSSFYSRLDSSFCFFSRSVALRIHREMNDPQRVDGRSFLISAAFDRLKSIFNGAFTDGSFRRWCQ